VSGQNGRWYVTIAQTDTITDGTIKSKAGSATVAQSSASAIFATFKSDVPPTIALDPQNEEGHR
jgi:hypothetical protein